METERNLNTTFPCRAAVGALISDDSSLITHVVPGTYSLLDIQAIGAIWTVQTKN